MFFRNISYLVYVPAMESIPDTSENYVGCMTQKQLNMSPFDEKIKYEVYTNGGKTAKETEKPSFIRCKLVECQETYERLVVTKNGVVVDGGFRAYINGTRVFGVTSEGQTEAKFLEWMSDDKSNKKMITQLNGSNGIYRLSSKLKWFGR